MHPDWTGTSVRSPGQRRNALREFAGLYAHAAMRCERLLARWHSAHHPAFSQAEGPFSAMFLSSCMCLTVARQQVIR